MTTELSPDESKWLADESGLLSSNLQRALVGCPRAIELTLVVVLSEGHLLLEDNPGTGKTTLARALAESIDGSWGRIQFTPDLLPADVTGSLVYNQSTSDFTFQPGPVFNNIILADEINRASPKTQSALLEVMQERQHTVDGTPHPLPRPSIVVATQNPVEMAGVYPLPEAQIDRFLIKTKIGYPAPEDEAAILSRSTSNPLTLNPCTTAARVSHMIGLVDRIYMSARMTRYIVDLAVETRKHPHVELGVSTRGAIALMRAAKARAATHGRQYATPDDVQDLIRPVLAHRLVLTAEADLAGRDVESILTDVLARVPPPLERE